MPVYYRQWFLKRLVKDLEKSKKDSNPKESKNMADNMKSLNQFEKMLAKKQK